MLFMANRELEVALIEFIDDDDAETGISIIYMQFALGETIKTVQHYCGMIEYTGITFRKLAPEERLRLSEAEINYYNHTTYTHRDE